MVGSQLECPKCRGKRISFTVHTNATGGTYPVVHVDRAERVVTAKCMQCASLIALPKEVVDMFVSVAEKGSNNEGD